MKTFLILCTALLLVGCSYSVKVGKKCTPGSTEWSYVWLVKGETDDIRKLFQDCGKITRQVISFILFMTFMQLIDKINDAANNYNRTKDSIKSSIRKSGTLL